MNRGWEFSYEIKYEEKIHMDITTSYMVILTIIA